MSATVQPTTSKWGKRHSDPSPSSQMDLKRPRNYYFRLESESSKASEEDSESVYSYQGRETDIARDTTDSDGPYSDPDNEYEVIEYDVASLSEDENDFESVTSSGSEDIMLAAAAVVMCDSSIEWVTDGEESDNSSMEDSVLFLGEFPTCVQCKSQNINPTYRYCDKCYQQSCRQCKMRKTDKGFPLCISCFKDRKKFFPPRPRARKRPKKNTKSSDPPVKLDTLRSCLKDLNQDSGVGSSQECPVLNLDKIVVPDAHLIPGTSQTSTTSSWSSSSLLSQDTQASSSASFDSGIGRKRQSSESSLSDFEIKKPKIDPETISLSQTSDLGWETTNTCVEKDTLEEKEKTNLNVNGKTSNETISKSAENGNSELCMFCNNAPKNGIFLHKNIAHQCCCYKCAKRTLNTIKRCPICNRSVNKVVKIYTA